MKRIICFGMVLALCLAAFAGCGKKNNKNREMYNVDLSEIVTVKDIKSVTVDTKAEEFDKKIEQIRISDVFQNSLFNEVSKTEGTVALGDTVNIDYEGKKDGVAFEGGTATGSELGIGSNSFIDGFEEGLIGKEIGSTVDLNLTFPESYQSAELAGKDVVFTVKINSVTKQAKGAEDCFESLGFKSLDEYKTDIKERVIRDYLSEELNKMVEAAEVKEYPEEEVDVMYDFNKKMLEAQLQSQYNMDMEGYLSAIGQTEEQFKSSFIKEQVKPMMKQQMALYAFLDKKGIEITAEHTEKAIEDAIKQSGDGVTAQQLKEYYGSDYFECIAASELVLDYLYDNAKIK